MLLMYIQDFMWILSKLKVYIFFVLIVLEKQFVAKQLQRQFNIAIKYVNREIERKEGNSLNKK